LGAYIGRSGFGTLRVAEIAHNHVREQSARSGESVRVMKTSKKPQSLAALAKTLDLNRERSSALQRVVALWEQGADSEELMKALDILAIAHVAASFEWASGSLS
jgi:hypothetical protein